MGCSRRVSAAAVSPYFSVNGLNADFLPLQARPLRLLPLSLR